MPTFDPILGPRSQERSRIGANGFVVLRLGVPCLHDAGSCSLARLQRGSESGQLDPCLGEYSCTRYKAAWRSRGAIRRYQGPTGAAWAAAGLPRRPTDGSDACPGAGKGLILESRVTEECRVRFLPNMQEEHVTFRARRVYGNKRERDASCLGIIRNSYAFDIHVRHSKHPTCGRVIPHTALSPTVMADEVMAHGSRWLRPPEKRHLSQVVANGRHHLIHRIASRCR